MTDDEVSDSVVFGSATRAELARYENQCDVCRAGKPLRDGVYHEMGGAAGAMVCQRERYEASLSLEEATKAVQTGFDSYYRRFECLPKK